MKLHMEPNKENKDAVNTVVEAGNSGAVSTADESRSSEKASQKKEEPEKATKRRSPAKKTSRKTAASASSLGQDAQSGTEKTETKPSAKPKTEKKTKAEAGGTSKEKNAPDEKPGAKKKTDAPKKTGRGRPPRVQKPVTEVPAPETEPAAVAASEPVSEEPPVIFTAESAPEANPVSAEPAKPSETSAPSEKPEQKEKPEKKEKKPNPRRSKRTPAKETKKENKENKEGPEVSEPANKGKSDLTPDAAEAKAQNTENTENPEKTENTPKEAVEHAAEPLPAVPKTPWKNGSPAKATAEEKQTEAVDVSGTPHETFVFLSPAQKAEQARKEAEAAAETAEPAVKPVEEATITAGKTTAPASGKNPEADSGFSPAEGPLQESRAAEGPKGREEKEKEKEKPANAGQTAHGSARRADPHEKEAMDKDRVRRDLLDVLLEKQQLERRFLIEETMKRAPLTEEERADNTPTSLANRVRSVVGSMLAELLAAHEIVVVGRKLALPEREEPNAEKAEKETVSESAPAEQILPIEKFEATADAPVFVRESVKEPEAEPVKESPVPVNFGGTEEPEPISPDIPEKPVSEGKPPVEKPNEKPAAEKSARAPRTRSGQSTPRVQTVSTVIITETELENAILNMVRRNPATKLSIFAGLKHIYAENRLMSKEEENQLYGAAGTVLQKLLSRGVIQNSDGRYLLKANNRSLNPGSSRFSANGYSTGNVEARFITELNRQSGDFFEQFAARLLEKYFEMSNIRVDASYVVGGSDDNGIDIMIETTDWLGYRERVFVQAKKRATQPVTLKEVREFYGALCAEDGTRGVFITTSNFCMEASKMIGKLRNLIAIDKRKLFSLAEHCEVGLIHDENGRLLLDENLFLDYDY